MLVAGGDDQVWPSLAMAESIAARRAASRLDTVLVTHPEADRRLGMAAWPHVEGLLRAQPK